MRLTRTLFIVVLAALVGATAALAATSRFDDVPDTSVFLGDIEWMADAAITLGCNPEGTQFCPDDPVTRAQMSAFMHRLARQVVGAPGPVELFAAVNFEPFSGLMSSVGPVEAFTRVGPGDYLLEFSENFEMMPGNSNAFIQVTPVATSGQSCSWLQVDDDASAIKVFCWIDGGGPTDMQVSVLVFSDFTVLPSL